jgi:hypothetical protein
MKNDYLKSVWKEAAVLIAIQFCSLLKGINLNVCKIKSIAFYVQFISVQFSVLVLLSVCLSIHLSIRLVVSYLFFLGTLATVPEA